MTAYDHHLCGAEQHQYVALYVCNVCRQKMISGGSRILFSNIIVEKVIEVDELDEGNTSAAVGKYDKVDCLAELCHTQN